MKSKVFSVLATVAALLVSGASAQAQSNDTEHTSGYDGNGLFARPTGTGHSYIPFTTEGYVGASIGASNYNLPNCAPGFACRDKDVAFKIFTGGQLFRVAGLELSYVNMGTAERSGGVTQAQGVNLSAIANTPIGPLNAFAKVGSTYGFTRTSGTSPGFASGRERGFGLSYGAGLRFDIGRDWGVRAEWDRMRFQYVDGRSAVNLFSTGIVYRFD